jgi:hypothetical protein
LGEVLSILRIPRKPITNAINPPVIALNDLLPGRGIARNTATDQQSDNLGIIQNPLQKMPAGKELALKGYRFSDTTSPK